MIRYIKGNLIFLGLCFVLMQQALLCEKVVLAQKPKYIIVSLREKVTQKFFCGSLQRLLTKASCADMISPDFQVGIIEFSIGRKSLDDFINKYSDFLESHREDIIGIITEANSQPAGDFDMAQLYLDFFNFSQITIAMTSDASQDSARQFVESFPQYRDKIKEFGRYKPQNFLDEILNLFFRN